MSSLQAPRYTSSSQLFVSIADTSSTADVFQGSQFSQQRVASYAQLLTGEAVAGRVIERLDLQMTPRELAEDVTASAVSDTVLIELSATASSPEQAQEIAEALGLEFIAFVDELERPDSGGPSPVKVTITDAAVVPEEPSSPQTLRNTLLGALIGLLVGAALAIARARLDRSVKDPDDASQLVGAPVVGTILRDRSLLEQHVIDQTGDARTAENYRQLRTNLQFLNVDEPPKVIMVSSALPSEGKTTLVVNLALTLAEAGRRVTVVEADLRRPKATRYLGLVPGAGLTNILAGTAEAEDVTQTYQGFSIIGAGPHPPNPGELLASEHMATLIAKLRGKNDYVLVDAPPLLPVADASGLAVSMDGVLLSVRYGATSKDHLRQAAVSLHRVGAKLLGVVLNIVPTKADTTAAYDYSYTSDRQT